MKENKETFGDIIYDHTLVKRTLMIAAFPALIKQTTNGEDTVYEGFLPAFDFAEVKDMPTEEECVEYLQDMLDDEVEELVVFEKALPDVEDDAVLMEKYPDYKIVYLDINVNALPDEEECTHDCSTCGGNCEAYWHAVECGNAEEDEDDCDCEDCCDDDCDYDDCDCCDDDCDCHEHHNN